MPMSSITTPAPGNGISRFLNGKQDSSNLRAPFGDTEYPYVPKACKILTGIEENLSV
jgi:hypothetical protein